MTNHPEQLLSAYMDDELSETDRREVEEHLVSCEACRTLLEDLIGLQSAVVHSYAGIQAPDDLESRILHAIDRKPTEKPVAKGWLSIPLVSFALLGVFLVLTGGVIVKLLTGVMKVMVALIYMVSHFIGTAPMLAGLTIIVSLGVLTVSGYSLRQLLQTKIS